MSGAAIAVGVDVATARRGLDLVALDAQRGIVASEGRLTAQDVARIVEELRPAVVCVDSPPGWALAGRSREAERALARLGISAYCTPCAAATTVTVTCHSPAGRPQCAGEQGAGWNVACSTEVPAVTATKLPDALPSCAAAELSTRTTAASELAGAVQE